MINRNRLIHRLGLVAVTLCFLAVTRDASAVERKGFIGGLAIGGGKISCEDCESLNGPAVALHLGGMLNEKLALVFDGSGVTKEEDGVTLTSVLASAALQYWVSPRVWVKGGVGGGQLSASGDGHTETSDTGLGFVGALGVEALQKEKFTIDLQVRYTTAKIEGERINNLSALVGFNFY